MRGTVAKRLRRQANVLTIGRKHSWTIRRVIKKFLKSEQVVSVNRDTRVNSVDSPRAVYLRLKQAWKRRAA